jgi:hypothetical protein
MEACDVSLHLIIDCESAVVNKRNPLAIQAWKGEANE